MLTLATIAAPTLLIAMPNAIDRVAAVPFRYSCRGGLRFIRIGRLNISFSFSKG
jgi:hypothetical protein